MGRVALRRVAQIAGVIQHEAQGDILGLGPGRCDAERRLLPRDDVGKVALTGPQGVGGRATDKEILEALYKVCGNGGGQGKGLGHVVAVV